MQRPDWAPADVSVDTASPARMYDALLGGSHNFEVDRMAAAGAVRMVPDLPRVAVSNRAFLRRAVRFLVDSGIRQFIDLGAGIPTVGNTHEVAQQADPGCRVVYVDIDSVAVAHATAILGDNPLASAVRGDVRTPDKVMVDPAVQRLIDWEQPVGVLLIAVLHMITDAEDPMEVVTGLRAAVPPGSYVAISHLTSAQRPQDAKRLGTHAANRSGVPIIFRTREQITGFFDGLTIVEPGVVELPQWRPETPDDLPEPPGRSLGLAGVGRKDR
ncbi:MAG: SAM-dependent methyltransferase [Micromonosporaceae bacterium]